MPYGNTTVLHAFDYDEVIAHATIKFVTVSGNTVPVLEMFLPPSNGALGTYTPAQVPAATVTETGTAGVAAISQATPGTPTYVLTMKSAYSRLLGLSYVFGNTSTSALTLTLDTGNATDLGWGTSSVGGSTLTFFTSAAPAAGVVLFLTLHLSASSTPS